MKEHSRLGGDMDSFQANDVDVERASALLAPVAWPTPAVECEQINEICGGRVILKLENLQRTGAFKFRGAYVALKSRLDAGTINREQGVVSWSSGNFGIGLAEAARLLAVPCAVVIPKDCDPLKKHALKERNATVLMYDRDTEDRTRVSAAYVQEHGGALIPSPDDAMLVAGQGTVTAEVLDQVDLRGLGLDAIIFNTSSGGLIAGGVTALRQRGVDILPVLVEPRGLDDFQASLKAGRVMSNVPGQKSICEALMSAHPGELPFAVMRSARVETAIVEDAAVCDAMVLMARWLGIRCEPSAVAGLAAIVSGQWPIEGRTVAIVITGGNIDPERFRRLCDRATVGT